VGAALTRDPDLDLVETIDRAMQAGRGSLMVLDPESRQWQQRPWTDVRDLGLRIATRVLDAGSGPRQPVGIVGETTAEVVAAVFGCWAAGRPISIMPMPVRGSDRRLWSESTMRRLRALDCGMVLAHGPVLELLRGTAGHVPVHDLAQVAGWRWDSEASLVRVPSDSPAVLQGTAGSTGTPRTAVLSHNAVLNHFWGLYDRTRTGSDDVLCSWLPMYHDMGLMLTVSGMAAGLATWLAPTSAFARMPFEWLNWLSASSATVTAAPNFAYNLIGRYARRTENVELGALRYMINGGEPVDCDGMMRFAGRLQRFGLAPDAPAPAYGLAEATCAVTAPDPGLGVRIDEAAIAENGATTTIRRHALLGRPLGGMEVRIAEPPMKVPVVAGRDIGLVEIRGHSIFSGYADDVATVGPADWTPTGDIGYLSGEELVVCGRSKEVVTVAGHNVFPQDVERVAALIPGVRPGGVVATMAAQRTEVRTERLLVVAEFSGKRVTGTEDRIIAAVMAECGVVPGKVVLVKPGELPRTTSGKLRRLEVSTWFS
jgi:long-chain-fatty-acid--[acyl-carrier-protein] ligase